MTSTSPPTPAATPRAGAGSIGQLRARVQAQAEADQEALTQAAVSQLASMSQKMQVALDEHVSAWTRRVSDELNTTQLAIASDLTRIHRSVRSVSNARWRWTVWPPIASILFSVLTLLVAGLISGSRLQGITVIEIDQRGQPMQVLTGNDWTTCRWQGEKHPCRPVQPEKE